MDNIVSIFADGGVISCNPSDIGGTWAWALIDNDNMPVLVDSGTITEISAPLPISNNVSELIAIVLALEQLPPGWSGNVYSDSNVSLGRLFRSWAMNGISHQWIARSKSAVDRLGKLTPILLDGHPTQRQLTSGTGKRGNLVSKWNVLCDNLCQIEAKRLLESINSHRLS